MYLNSFGGFAGVLMHKNESVDEPCKGWVLLKKVTGSRWEAMLVRKRKRDTCLTDPSGAVAKACVG